VFRVAGSGDLPDQLALLRPITLLTTRDGERTVCLLALEPGEVPAFGRIARELAVSGAIERVEAEPHL